MEMNEYENEAKQIIAEKSGVAEEEISSESHFEYDLNIGELELAEILEHLEDILDVSNLIENMDNIETFEDLLGFLSDQLE